MFILGVGCVTPFANAFGRSAAPGSSVCLSDPDTVIVNTTNAQHLSQTNDINFQVNTEIEYLNLVHFKNPEAKNFFVQALEKEREAKGIETESGTLRIAYAEAKDDKKSELAEKILRQEQKMMDINASLPELYDKARKLEAEYWSKASDAEIQKFKTEIIKYQDSLTHIEQNQLNAFKPQGLFAKDTINYFPPGQKMVVKAEKSSPVIYKIQIGAYKGKIPDATTKLIKKLSVIRKIEDSKDEKGYVVYTTGNLKTYQEALTMQGQVKQEGVKNPVITAFLDGKKISLEEAKKINNE